MKQTLTGDDVGVVLLLVDSFLDTVFFGDWGLEFELAEVGFLGECIIDGSAFLGDAVVDDDDDDDDDSEGVVVVTVGVEVEARDDMDVISIFLSKTAVVNGFLTLSLPFV